MRSQSLSAAWSPLPARASWPSSARRRGRREKDRSSSLRRAVQDATSSGQRTKRAWLRSTLRARGWPARAREAAALRRHLLSRSRLRSSCCLAGQVLLRPVRPRCSRAWPPRAASSAGSARCGRASAHRSARPAAMMLLTWSASEIAPTAIVAMPASLRIAVGERRLVHAAVDRLRLARRPGPTSTSIRSAPAALNSRAIATASSGVLPPSAQSCAEMRTDIGSCCRPHGAHRAEHFERIAAAVLERAAVLVVALVGERRDERRQQVAVRAVQLEPVEAGLGAAARGAHEVGASRGPCRRASSRARPGCARRQVLLRRRRRSAASCRSASGWSLAFPAAAASSPWRRRGRAACAIFAVACWRARSRRCASRRRAAPSFHMPAQPGVMRASGETQVISVNTSPAPPVRARAEVHEVVVVGHAVDARVLRHRRDDDAVLAA